jgi:hypothetical protein
MSITFVSMIRLNLGSYAGGCACTRYASYWKISYRVLPHSKSRELICGCYSRDIPTRQLLGLFPPVRSNASKAYRVFQCIWHCLDIRCRHFENSSQASHSVSNVFGSFENGPPNTSDMLYLCPTYWRVEIIPTGITGESECPEINSHKQVHEIWLLQVIMQDPAVLSWPLWPSSIRSVNKPVSPHQRVSQRSQ